MKPSDWKRIKEVFHEALRLEESERENYLDRECGPGSEMRFEVESLLTSLSDAQAFLEVPVLGEANLPNDGWRLADGQQISHYKVISPIAVGGMGEVYLAEDLVLRRKVALKILPELLFDDAERLARFKREADAISALNHPNILTIFEFGSEGDIQMFASEFVEGHTLRERLKSGPLAVEDALDIGLQIVSALKAAHAAGVIHRDIKPENVMIRKDGYVKVLDFGLAKLTGPNHGATDSGKYRSISSPGMIMGTVSYMSPEQARGKTIDSRTDIFSFGVVLFEMLAGRTPFKGETTTDVIAKIIQNNPPPLREFNPSVPSVLEAIVSRCLEKQAEDRYRSTTELEPDLKAVKRKFDNTTDQATEILETPVTADHNSVTGSNVGAITEKSASPRTYIAWASAAAVAAILIFAAFWNGGQIFGRSQIESLAVMPFANESGNPDLEYLSDGMTESLINSLSNLPNLSVKARNSVFRYKGSEIDEKKIGQDLNVQAVVLGRFTQRGDDITLHLSLVDSKTGTTIWGEQYDRKVRDLSVLQKDITRDVSQKLRMRLSNADARNLTKGYSENTEAYQLYLKGRYFFNRRTPADFQKSRDYFQRAIDADPTYARAYSGLADYYGISTVFGDLPPNETWPKHEALVKKALELDPDLAEAHNSLAGLRRNYYRDWAGAEQALKRAIALDPNYAEARVQYGSHLSIMGRNDEALAERKRAVDLDPLSASVNMRLAQTLYFMRRYPEAMEQYRKTIDLDPGNPIAHEWLGNVYEQSGMFEQAIDEWSTALTLSKNDELAEMLKIEFKKAGFNAAVRAVARKKLDLLNARIQRGDYIPAMRLARPYAQLGERDQTFSWLEKGAVEQNAFVVEILYDPVFDSLRDDPRFPDVIRRMGLPR